MAPGAGLLCVPTLGPIMAGGQAWKIGGYSVKLRQQLTAR
jgi:hypothetical protein